MSFPDQAPFPPGVATEAAEWFIKLQGTEVSHQDQEAFADWLRRSPVHVEEFLRLTALQGNLTRLPEFRRLDVAALLAELAASGINENVVPFRSDMGETSAASRPLAGAAEAIGLSRGGHSILRALRVRHGVAAAATLAVILLGIAASGFIGEFLGKRHYRTDIGEQRSLTLADGSQVQLNAVSNLSARVDNSVRLLDLTDGEALFRVAKDPARPFRVHTPEATIEAKGTQFDVHVSRGVTVVSLLEGHVLVTPPSGRDADGKGAGNAAPILLNPGEQISIAAHATSAPKPRKVDTRTAIAWTQHRLVFEDAPLSEVISEFNRYSREPFFVEDAALRELRITASFDAGSTQTFAESLTAAGDLRVTRRDAGGWLIERK